MKIAVLGGGFAGLSLAWYLCRYTTGSARIDIYDPAPITMGASRVSLGILNPYMGRQAKKAWESDHCIKEVHRLITESSNAGEKPIILATGLLRPACTQEQIQEFQARASDYSDTQWWDKAACEKAVQGLQLPFAGGGLYIPHAVTLNIDQYLRGLWINIARHSVQYLKFSVLGKDTLAPYDRVVIAMGANCLDFAVLKDLPITRVKGQVLQLKWPEHLPPLPMSVAGEGQLVMSPDYKSCLVGSTYERDFKDFHSDQEFARREILNKISPFFPSLASAPIIECRARIRASSKSHLPMLGKVNDKIWFYTGLGSKGLLYHAWASSKLAQAVLLNDVSLIPTELFYPFEQKPTEPPLPH
ncbi:MAG: FAD-binding oxidoreductase [Verrucomicrobia bacterium]|nr:FAD-binding oxidoreductase [Verrucomicrobiota bacterium]MBS0645962.1 FAD-binding oxidoreductase [Verrucomicrobiota bacterium]